MVRFIIDEHYCGVIIDRYLHSNMVRFIIKSKNGIAKLGRVIYIPIWLDLLSAEKLEDEFWKEIYIPIWLDLL